MNDICTWCEKEIVHEPFAPARTIFVHYSNDEELPFHARCLYIEMIMFAVKLKKEREKEINHDPT